MENDLISRKSLMEKIDHWANQVKGGIHHTDRIVWDVLEGVTDTICDEEAVEAAPRWISVKDGLPEKTGMYLAHLVHSYSNEDEYSCVTVCFFDLNARPKWAIEGRLYKVTHWMPLPKPPEEDEQ